MAETAQARLILHVDMDAFFASVEQRDHPELRGRPLVVGSPPNERGVVAAASYEARKFGIHSAMPSSEAGRRCPHAVFVPPDMARYAAVSSQVMEILERFTPFVEPVSIDEAFLDVTGATALFGNGEAIARKIRATIQKELSLTASVGVATNKFLAKLASDMNKPDGYTLVPSDPDAIRAFLAPLPVGRLWGVGKVTRAVLEKAGLHTIADIQARPLSGLSSIVGARHARHLKELAAGHDDRTVETESEEKSISREYTFKHDCRDHAVIRSTLLELVDDVGRQLREAGKYARVVNIKIRWSDFETLDRQRTLETGVCDDFALRAAGLELLAKQPLIHPVRLVGFGVSSLSRTAVQQLSLFGGHGTDRVRLERLSHTVDKLRQQFGDRISVGRTPAAGTKTGKTRRPSVRDE